jgi:hypothetical protein
MRPTLAVCTSPPSLPPQHKFPCQTPTASEWTEDGLGVSDACLHGCSTFTVEFTTQICHKDRRPSTINAPITSAFMGPVRSSIWRCRSVRGVLRGRPYGKGMRPAIEHALFTVRSDPCGMNVTVMNTWWPVARAFSGEGRNGTVVPT